MMAQKSVVPSPGRKSFTCPHCGAFADQTWYELTAIKLDRLPSVITAESKSETIGYIRQHTGGGADADERVNQFSAIADRQMSGEIELGTDKQHYGSDVTNVFLSECYSCERISLWHRERVLYPTVRTGVEPNDDLPDEIKYDFQEARTLLQLSPRGAAALLRLCIQKLCVHLGQKGKNINDDIAALIAAGLPVEVKQAMDVVRVIGNEAVHPGQIDLNDNREIASQLFAIVNFIAERMITQPKQLKALYDSLPPAKIAEIEKRDKNSLGTQ
jgi:hypothetical protein